MSVSSYLIGALRPVSHTGLMLVSVSSYLVGALSPVNHTGLYQG